MEEYISNQEGKRIFKDTVNKLKNAGYLISAKNINLIDFTDIGQDVGHFWLEDVGKYNFRLNSKLLQKNKNNFLLCAIYHELAHAIQYNECFDQKIISYNKDTDEIHAITNNENLAINTLFDDNGHTMLWNDIVKELNSLFKPSPPITAYLSEVDLKKFLEEIFMQKLRKNSLHIDKTISGLTIDDMMKYNVKPEYRVNTVTESYKPNHSYRDFKKYEAEVNNE